MLKKSAVFFGIACAMAAVGSAQAATPTVLTPITTVSGDTFWQNIGQVSYTFADNNNDKRLDVGDTVTFSLTMEKDHWGTHRYDAMKVWLDDGAGHNLVTQDFTWFYYQDDTLSRRAKRTYDQIKNDSSYSDKLWRGGVEVFKFSYTFEKAGTYDLLASVMCSRDLSGLSGTADDKPSGADWDKWTRDIHTTFNNNHQWLQGQDKRYQLTIAAVPEPETYAMMIAGLTLLGAIVRRRKQA